MIKDATITIDVGTTNCKVTVFHIQSGDLLEIIRFPTPKIQDADGELFDFNTLWGKLLCNIKIFIKKYKNKIDSIIISSVGESGMLIDENGYPIGPMIAWYDKRSYRYIDALTKEQRSYIYQVTGLPAHSNYGISKIKWLVEHYVKDNVGILTWMTIPDLIAYKLTKTRKTEYSIANRTMCFNLHTRTWSKELLTIFNLPNTIQFPDVVAAGETIGYMTSNLKKQCDITEDIKICIAGHDHMVGAQAVHLKEKQLLNSTGTTEGVLYIEKKLDVSFKNSYNYLAHGIYTDPAYYTLFSSMPTGGITFEWIKRFFHITNEECNSIIHQLMNQYKEMDLPNMDTIITVPHHQGSGAPYKQSNAKALLYGITTTTSIEDIIFSHILGLGLEFKNVIQCFPIKSINQIIVIGPATKNALWLQIKADVLQKQIVALDIEEAVSYGAMKLVYPSFKKPTTYKIYQPNKEKEQYINTIFEKYQYLYNKKKQLELPF